MEHLDSFWDALLRQGFQGGTQRAQHSRAHSSHKLATLPSYASGLTDEVIIGGLYTRHWFALSSQYLGMHFVLFNLLVNCGAIPQSLPFQ